MPLSLERVYSDRYRSAVSPCGATGEGNVVYGTMRLPLDGFGCGGLIVTSRIDQDYVRAICQFEIFQDLHDLC